MRPTDDKTYKKIINFTKTINDEEQQRLHTVTYNDNPMANITQSSSVFTRSKFDNSIVTKIGYDWKTIYRMLTLYDTQETGIVTLA